ncbi:hypothetical protein BJ170DRAFT_594655 [Xylariales sp. AK1849]|nr:hypothetical protein BJ170DRAFT_594655 [Xylariales sp. AK1849]
MSLPPQLIRVKRKATEEAPVSFLRVQENKRHRSEDFVYQRQQQEAAFADIPPPVERPIIHSSDGSAFQSPRNRNKNTIQSKGRHGVATPDPASLATDSTVGASASEPRRFHMSRADMMLATPKYPTYRSHGGISKKRSAPALFVERKVKRQASTTFNSVTHGLNAQTTTRAIPPLSDESHITASDSLPEHMEVDVAGTRKLKKPGLARLAQKDGIPTAKAELPLAMVDRWNVNLDQLTSDMNAFAMEQIGLNLQRAEQEKQQQNKTETQIRATSQSRPSRFKPKVPTERYAERHPEVVGPSDDNEMIDKDAGADAALSDTDDEGYIIETYVRVPASTIEQTHIPSQKVGLLVFDAEPDLEIFYGGDSDSDDEWAEDEEDENAENYYTADYPDEEVASDDEFGQNPYAYRTGNASDLEEYDVAGGAESSPTDDPNDKEGFKSLKGPDGRIRKQL